MRNLVPGLDLAREDLELLDQHGGCTKIELWCCSGGQLEARGIDVAGILVNVDEDRGGTEPGHDLGGRREGEAWAEDRVAGLETLGHEHHAERIGTIRAGDDVL